MRQSRLPDEIIVVDNDSGDGSADCVKQYSGVTLHLNNSNSGFSKANNFAIAQCDTEFVVLLNPDAFPEPEWLQKLLFAAECFPEVAAFGSRLMMYEADGLVDGLGDTYHFSGLVWRHGHGRKMVAADAHPKEIFSPCAGAVLYRTGAFRAAGGFDEDFFCYVEDIDLGFRLRLAGYRSMYVPDAVVHHVGSACSGGPHSNFAIYHGHRNLVWAYVKNMPGWLFWGCLPIHLAMNITLTCWFVLQGRGSVILRAKRDAILGLPKMWRKRKLVQQQRRVSVYEIWRVLGKRL